MWLAPFVIACRSASDIDVPSPEAVDPAVLAAIDAWWADYGDDAAAGGVVGAQAAVVWDGRLVWTGVYGHARDGGDAVADTTLFNIASLSKAFTAAAILGAETDGLVDRGAPVTDHVDLPVQGGGQADDITLDRALAHAAGLPDYRATVEAFVDCEPWRTVSAALEHMSTPPLTTDPSAWAAFVGTYSDVWQGFGRQVVTRDDDVLTVTFPDFDPPIEARLEQVAPYGFGFEVDGYVERMAFWPDGDEAEARWFVHRGFAGDRDATTARARGAPRFDPPIPSSRWAR